MKKVVIVVTLVAFVTPALAQSEFYIVQDTTTKKCTIVDKKPTVTTRTVVTPAGTIYKTRAEAETGMKRVKVCTVPSQVLAGFLGSPWPSLSASRGDP